MAAVAAAEVNPNSNVRPYHKIDGLTTIYENMGLPVCVSLLFETAEKAEKFAKIISESNLMKGMAQFERSDLHRQ